MNQAHGSRTVSLYIKIEIFWKVVKNFIDENKVRSLSAQDIYKRNAWLLSGKIKNTFWTTKILDTLGMWQYFHTSLF